ncbi:MAG: hypothetical protein KGM47_02545, partial [Acidobacteriota bacterium]|nr:hypothetical protein [Acidobacteriota bacterium]
RMQLPGAKHPASVKLLPPDCEGTRTLTAERSGNALRFFSARLDQVVARYARETNRARDLSLLTGHALGGSPGGEPDEPIEYDDQR